MMTIVIFMYSVDRHFNGRLFIPKLSWTMYLVRLARSKISTLCWGGLDISNDLNCGLPYQLIGGLEWNDRPFS